MYKRQVKITVNDEVYEWELTAIPAKELDALQLRYPPTKAQRERGMATNTDKFGPALLAACSTEPTLTEEEAQEIWSSDAFSTGELNELFNACTTVCMAGFDVTPIVTD